tara:strand:- start:666 stop:914 length:249 start_codon:yes stop_codon:yes gene_type:complete
MRIDLGDENIRSMSDNNDEEYEEYDGPWITSQCTEDGCDCEGTAFPKHWYFSYDGPEIVIHYECNGHEWKETYKYQGKDYLN